MTRRGMQQLLAIASLVLTTCSAASAADEHWTWARRPGESLALQHGDAIVWRFNYGLDEPKPYFHPVALPDGTVLTQDRPPDHPWHHGLWFCWKYINGVNYWEPDPATGRPAGRTQWDDVRAATQPDHSARIQMRLTYRPADGPPVMTEDRVVAISAPDSEGCYHFGWTCKFTAGGADVTLDRTPLPGEPGGKAWGGYAGLSVRLAADLAKRGAVSTDGPVAFNEQSRFRGKALAMDYHGRLGGRPVGVAICDHPDNLNHPSPWYVIRTPTMSYFTPAVICYQPYTLKAGRSFTLRYRVIIHPGAWTAERLRLELRRFAPSSPP